MMGTLQTKLTQVHSCRATDALLLLVAPASHLLSVLGLALLLLGALGAHLLGDDEKSGFRARQPSARRSAQCPHLQRIAQPETPH
jgi:hypothetical protein